MRRLQAVFLLICFCFNGFLLPGCKETGPDRQNDTIKIGVALYDQYDTFVGELMSAFTRLARQKEQEEGVTITILQESANGNQTLQNTQVESFLEAGCDILCVNLVDRTDASVIIDKAIAANTPILFFNRELVEEDLARSDLLYYVGADAVESGRIQGEIVADLYKKEQSAVDKNNDGKLQYVMLEGEPGHQDAIVRTETSINTLVEAGVRVERLEDEIANWVRAQAETRMTGWIAEHGQAIEVVFANNDDMALGAIDALKRAEMPHESWPVIVGIDATAPGLEAVSLGEMAGTVYNDAEGQAQKLLELALALTIGTPMPELTDGKYIRLAYHKVTMENVIAYINKKGQV